MTVARLSARKLLCQGFRPFPCQSTNRPLEPGEIGGVHAEGADSDPEKERQIPLLVGHVPADGHVSPMVTSRIDNPLDRPQDRRVVGDVEACDPLVRPVHRKDVLDEIIGPDGKEVGFAREGVNQLHDRGEFDHHADLRAVVVGHPFSLKGGDATAEDLPCFLELFQRGDHREHDAGVCSQRTPEGWRESAG